ncbi:MAG: CNNM domain-containing protein [Planctomycetota bacterium]|nr:CNNM domain-containing protein [Planctomycetota bacterium]
MTLLTMAALLFCSGAVSGCETAVFSLKALERRTLSERNRAVAALLARPSRLLVSLLLANLIINVGYFTLSASLSLRYVEQGHTGLAVAVAAISLGGMVVGGEIVPKMFALTGGPATVARMAPALSVLSFVLAPAVLVGSWVTEALEGLLFRSRQPRAVNSSDIKVILGEGRKSGSYRGVELALLNDVIDFGERKAKALMVSRVDMTVLDMRDNRNHWVEVMSSSPHTDYPVIDGAPDALVGVINAARFLLEPGLSREALLEPAMLAPLGIGAERLVLRMIDERQRLAILLDEFGGVAGVVGQAQLSRELLGEIEPSAAGPVEHLSDGAALVSGQCPVHRLEEELGLALQARRAGTVGGAVAEALAAVPRRGDELRLEGWRLRVLSMRGHRVDRLFVTPESTGRGGDKGTAS